MPRLTNKQYLARRAFLAKIWRTAFIMLDPNQQQALHAYYQLSKDWTTEQALAHRKLISKQRPSLPAASGKYFSELCEFLEKRDDQSASQRADPTPLAPRVHVPAGKHRQVRVRSLVNPDPDPRVVAFALMQLVKEQQKLQMDEHLNGEAA